MEDDDPQDQKGLKDVSEGQYIDYNHTQSHRMETQEDCLYGVLVNERLQDNISYLLRRWTQAVRTGPDDDVVLQTRTPKLLNQISITLGSNKPSQSLKLYAQDNFKKDSDSICNQDEPEYSSFSSNLCLNHSYVTGSPNQNTQGRDSRRDKWSKKVKNKLQNLKAYILQKTRVKQQLQIPYCCLQLGLFRHFVRSASGIQDQSSRCQAFGLLRSCSSNLLKLMETCEVSEMMLRLREYAEKCQKEQSYSKAYEYAKTANYLKPKERWPIVIMIRSIASQAEINSEYFIDFTNNHGLDHGIEEVYREQVKVYEELGYTENKKHCLKKLISIKPSEKDYIELLELYKGEGNTNEVRKLSARFVKVHERKGFPLMPQFCDRVIEFLHQGHFYQEELTFLNLSLKFCKDKEKKLSRRVEVYRRLKDEAGVLESLKELTKFNKNNMEAVSEIAIYYESKGDYWNAGKYYGVLLNKAPESVYLIKKLINCIRERKGTNPCKEDECQVIRQEYLSKLERFKLFYLYKYHKLHKTALRLMEDKLSDVSQHKDRQKTKLFLEDTLERMKTFLRNKKDYLMVLVVGKLYTALGKEQDKNQFYRHQLIAIEKQDPKKKNFIVSFGRFFDHYLKILDQDQIRFLFEEIQSTFSILTNPQTSAKAKKSYSKVLQKTLVENLETDSVEAVFQKSLQDLKQFWMGQHDSTALDTSKFRVGQLTEEVNSSSGSTPKLKEKSNSVIRETKESDGSDSDKGAPVQG